MPDQDALLIMDSFTGQKTTQVLEKLEENNIMVVFVPGGTTDRLQPLDLSVNKSAKDFMRGKFRQWYAKEVEKAVQSESEDIEVDMRGTIMKELGAKWLTALYDHMCSHPETIKNGFKDAGITETLQNMADQMS